MNVAVTGVAGFIGFHLAHRLLDNGHRVFGIDNLNPYYDPSLKEDRLSQLEPHEGFTFSRLDIADRPGMEKVFAGQRFDAVVHLAAQAGVRYSIDNPHAYVESNLTGFLHILEGCRHSRVPHLVFASSSSVYGANTKMPFSVHDNVDHPISLYAATKKANELMAHTYAALYGIPCTGLRFFTVYGPWGRPDMALFKFTRSILEGKAIDIYNYGDMQRDFTYIDDIVEGVYRAMRLTPEPDKAWDGSRPDPGTSFAPYRIYNIGGSSPVHLMHFIEVLEKALGRQAEKNMLPLQKGDVKATCADALDLEKAVGFRPGVSVDVGIRRFVDWYRSYYRV
ncbi:MAG TPA: NAD-dependent epimerase [Deltaproteobacteria bacterium]|nr:NAD-dependent epimerase [Deltaproteobacteria bacterium]HPR56289.1 NAD-dependent epimerase [Deltaproteobacteria bacterium]HXK46477.1 NAD-dependent epimerase [Deltaproteobacteria bacterium]